MGISLFPLVLHPRRINEAYPSSRPFPKRQPSTVATFLSTFLSYLTLDPLLLQCQDLSSLKPSTFVRYDSSERRKNNPCNNVACDRYCVHLYGDTSPLVGFVIAPIIWRIETVLRTSRKGGRLDKAERGVALLAETGGRLPRGGIERGNGCESQRYSVISSDSWTTSASISHPFLERGFVRTAGHSNLLHTVIKRRTRPPW